MPERGGRSPASRPPCCSFPSATSQMLKGGRCRAHPFAVRTALRLAVAFAVLACLPATASAQYFGRNKVQYEKFQWRVLKTEHFDIYFYPEEEQRRARRRPHGGALVRPPVARSSATSSTSASRSSSTPITADFQQTTIDRRPDRRGDGRLHRGARGPRRPAAHRRLRGHRPRPRPRAGARLPVRHPAGAPARRAGVGGAARPGRRQSSRSGSSRGWPSTCRWAATRRRRRCTCATPSPATPCRTSRSCRAIRGYFPYRWGHAFWAYVGGRWGDLTVGRLFLAAREIGVEAALQEVLGVRCQAALRGLEGVHPRRLRAGDRGAGRRPPRLGQRVLPPQETEDDRHLRLAGRSARTARSSPSSPPAACSPSTSSSRTPAPARSGASWCRRTPTRTSIRCASSTRPAPGRRTARSSPSSSARGETTTLAIVDVQLAPHRAADRRPGGRPALEPRLVAGRPLHRRLRLGRRRHRPLPGRRGRAGRSRRLTNDALRRPAARLVAGRPHPRLRLRPRRETAAIRQLDIRRRRHLAASTWRAASSAAARRADAPAPPRSTRASGRAGRTSTSSRTAPG